MTKPEEADKGPTRRPIIRSPYVRLPSKKFLFPYWALKIVASLVGFVGTVLCMMAIVGAVTDDIYARLGGGLLGAIAAPLTIGLLWRWRRDRSDRKGIITDVLALFWLGFTFLFAFAAASVSGNFIHVEADRLMLLEAGPPVQIAYFLASPASSGLFVDAGWDGAPPPHEPFASEADAAAMALRAPEPPPPVKDAGPSWAPARDAGPAAKLPIDIFHEASPSIVTIAASDRRGERGGTGFLIDEAGTIATARHVIEGAVVVRVELFDGRSFEPVDLLAEDAANDVALLRIDLANPLDAGAPPGDGGAPLPRPLVLADSDAVVPGEPALAVGNPLGLEPTFTDSIVSGRLVRDGRAWIQLSEPIAPGNAGAPVLNGRGEVIGITAGQVGSFLGQTQNLSLALPASVLKALVKPSYPDRHPFCGYTTCTQW